MQEQSGYVIQGFFFDNGVGCVETITLVGMPLIGSTIGNYPLQELLLPVMTGQMNIQSGTTKEEVTFAFELSGGGEGVVPWSSGTLSPGGFDSDNDVGEVNFLAGQRGFSNICDAPNLFAWKAIMVTASNTD